MRTLTRTSVVLVLVLLTGACANAFRAGAAVVNGVSISQEDVAERIRNAAGAEQEPTPELERSALQQLIEEQVVRGEAEVRGITAGADEVQQNFDAVKAQFGSGPQSFEDLLATRGFTEESFRRVLADDIVRRNLAAELAAPVSEEEVRRTYEASAEQYRETRSRHILYRVEDQANDGPALKKAESAVRRLRGGANFAKIARAESDDPGSGAQGGDLGFSRAGDFVPEFEQAADAARIGEIVGPVRSQFGYHVIEVLERRTVPLSEVAFEIRSGLEQQLAERAIGEFLADALEGASIVVNPRYGEWDAQAGAIVARESFTPAEPETDPLAPPGGFPPIGG